MNRAVFVLGSHRTGTRSLAGFFAACCPEVAAFHQPSGLRLLNVLSNMQISGWLPPGILETAVRCITVARIRAQRAPIYLEANGFNYLAAGIVRRYGADVRIVHVVRDPRTYVTSYLNWLHERRQSRWAHAYVPFWNVEGDRLGLVERSRWRTMTAFERFCWQWTFKNQLIMDRYGSDPDRYCLIRFEDLTAVDRRQAQIDRLLQFVETECRQGCERYFDTPTNQTRTGHFPHWRAWSPDQCRRLDELCGPLMDRFGYGGEAAWQELRARR